MFFPTLTPVSYTHLDGIYKLDYNKILQYHIEKKADVTVVVKKLDNRADIGRYGVVALTDEGRITDIDEKPLETNLSTVSTRCV